MIFLRKIKLTWFTMFFIIFTLPKSILLFKLIFFYIFFLTMLLMVKYATNIMVRMHQEHL